MAKSTDDQMIGLLNQILRVQAIQAVSSLSITEGARLLKIAGLDNQTISEVLNTSAATVRTVTTNLWDRPKKKRRKGK